MKTTLISPYGNKLINLIASPEERDTLNKKVADLPSIQLSQRSLFDLELLATGAFSPLDRFMGKKDYTHVIETMKLANGMIFPIPITLPIQNPKEVIVGRQVVLRNPLNEPIAIMTVDEVYEWEYNKEAQLVYGTRDTSHPLLGEMTSWGKYNISGPIKVFNLPKHYDFQSLRHTPKESRTILTKLGFANVVAFQTRNPMHRAHEVITKESLKKVNGALLIHPVVGLTKSDDIDYVVRVYAYKVLYDKYYDHARTLLSLIPLAMRMAGQKEAVWHAIIRRNYGANYFIVGRDHASPGKNANGKPFYPPYKAAQLLESIHTELGVHILPFQEIVYVPSKKRFVSIDKTLQSKWRSVSGTEVKTKYLIGKQKLPSWFTRPEVAKILTRAYPPPDRAGLCIWFTGLPGAGKSTIAQILQVLIRERGREVTLLDGDIIRTHLSKGLGFSKDDRDTNILRIGFVASEIVRHNGIVICAAVSPYEATRNQVRSLIGGNKFILIYINTPVRLCEIRDTKGMYRKAKKGQLKNFTGVNDPYEVPTAPTITLTTTNISPMANAQKIIRYLTKRGILPKLQ